jgi:hypothetical protein
MPYDSDQLSLLDVLLDVSLHPPLPLNLARVIQDPFPVCTENLSSSVVMVKSAKDGV